MEHMFVQDHLMSHISSGKMFCAQLRENNTVHQHQNLIPTVKHCREGASGFSFVLDASQSLKEQRIQKCINTFYRKMPRRQSTTLSFKEAV